MMPVEYPSTRWSSARLVPAVVAIAFFMQLLDGTIISTSLPAMASSFATDVVSMNLGFTVYMLAMAICIPPAGWLADRFGARTVFATAIGLFTLASIACALATSFPMFLAARILQGASGAMMTPVGRQIVLQATPKSELVRAIALITWPALIAPVLGPVIGGWVTTAFGWEWNFLINVPLGLLGLVLVMKFVPEDRPKAPRSFDSWGFVLTSGALALFLSGLELFSGPNGGAWALALVVAGVVSALLAIRHLRRTAHPLLDLSVLSVPTFALATLTSGTAGRLAINATPFLLPLLFQVGFGFDALQTGHLILVYFLGNLMMKSVTTPLLRILGFRRLLVANGMLAAGSVAAFALVEPDTAYGLLAPLLLFAGLTRSMQFTSLSTIAFADVAPEQRGAATTIAAMLQQLSMLLGVALSVLVIRLSAFLQAGGVDAPAVSLADIRAAFVAVAVVGLVSALRFLVLPPDAGAEVSGHRA